MRYASAPESDQCVLRCLLRECPMHDKLQAIFDWLNGEPTPDDVAAWRRDLGADPELLAAFLAEVRFDHQLSRCLANETTAAGVPPLRTESVAETRSTNMNAEQQKIWAKIVAQAWADETYKARLLAEPAAVLREEGLEVPADKAIRIVENTDAQVHLILPALPPDSGTSPLSACEERLAAACSVCFIH